MKVYISADMEGATGLTSFHQVNPHNPEFQHFRAVWTEDVNQLVEGAFDAGATEVLVNESHDGMNYLLPDKLHPAASFLSGRLKPKNQMQCIEGFDLAFICTHAMAGQPGVLSHSFVMPDFFEMRLNGKPIGELGLNILMASEFGVPMALVVGDDTACREAKELIPNIECVETKRYITQISAICPPTGQLSLALREGASNAVKNARSISLYRIAPPYKFEVTFTIPAMTELVSYIPGVTLNGPRTAMFITSDYLEMTRIRILMVNLARVISGRIMDS